MNFKFLLNIFQFRKNNIIDLYNNLKTQRSQLKCYILAPPLSNPEYYIEKNNTKQKRFNKLKFFYFSSLIT